MVYYFARADQMLGHRFTDDVAVCRAFTKKQAIKRFSNLYAEVAESEVKRVRWHYYKSKVVILTDY